MTEAGISQAETGRMIDAITNTIGNALTEGSNVALVGFGTFQVIAKSAHTGRNSSTGAAIAIAARNAPTFKAGKTLKDKVN